MLKELAWAMNNVGASNTRMSRKQTSDLDTAEVVTEQACARENIESLKSELRRATSHRMLKTSK
jgi:hypothetical protein